MTRSSDHPIRTPLPPAFPQLQRDRLRDQLRIQFRLMYFQNIEEHLTVGALLHVALELVDLGALAPNNDSRTRRLDNHPQLVAGTLNLDAAHARRLELLFQLILQLDVFEQQLVVIAFHKPARLPRLGVPKPESIRMYLLSHKAPENQLPVLSAQSSVNPSA